MNKLNKKPGSVLGTHKHDVQHWTFYTIDFIISTFSSTMILQTKYDTYSVTLFCVFFVCFFTAAMKSLLWE